MGDRELTTGRSSFEDAAASWWAWAKGVEEPNQTTCTHVITGRFVATSRVCRRLRDHGGIAAGPGVARAEAGPSQFDSDQLAS